MAGTLISMFESFSEAEQARSELLALGFPEENVQFSVRDDEAGPVEGNFYIGNGNEEGGSNRTAKDTSYSKNFSAVQRGIYMLIVEASDEAQMGRAREILDRLGGVDADARVPASSVQKTPGAAP